MGLYYEAHVTIEPVFDQRLEQFKEICKQYKFRVADLLMQKRVEDTPERSKHDTFCTGRHRDLYWMEHYTVELVHHLKKEQFKVWRYKIEDTILDSNINDRWNMLDDRKSS